MYAILIINFRDFFCEKLKKKNSKYLDYFFQFLINFFLKNYLLILGHTLVKHIN